MATIAELSEDRTVDAVFAVARKRRLTTRKGKPYLALELVDPSGRIEGRIGRFLAVLGGLRPLHLDGVSTRVRLPGQLAIEAFGGMPVVCVELAQSGRRRPEEDLRRELRAIGDRYDHTRHIAAFHFHPGFPVDVRHNSKIFREKLAAWVHDRMWPRAFKSGRGTPV